MRGKEFIRGFAAAVTEIVRLHGETTIAADVLKASGLRLNDLRKAGVETYDMKVFEHLEKEGLLKEEPAE
jgi:hypothetical protein